MYIQIRKCTYEISAVYQVHQRAFSLYIRIREYVYCFNPAHICRICTAIETKRKPIECIKYFSGLITQLYRN